jgi:uncharacterized membrane protein
VQRTEATARGRDPRSLLRSLITDPARCFLAVGAVVGVLLVCVIPPLGGIDEPAHFVRAYQISTGRLVPETPLGESEGGGACIPADVSRQIGELAYENFGRVVDLPDRSADELPAGPRGRCARREAFFDFSAFGWYSPISYLPQSATILVGRGLGLDVRAMAFVARLAGLAAYLALVFFAIRRSPFARWGLCAVALLPVALFQAATSRAPDAITIGVGMLVLGAALRAMRGGTSVADGGSPLAERIALCMLLGALKPTYAVLSLCFVLPALTRGRKERWTTMAAPVVAAFATSFVWQAFAGHYFVCDTFFFGWQPNTDDQIHTILNSPFRYAWHVLGSFPDYAGKWFEETVTVGATVSNWAWPAVALGVGAFVVAGARRDVTEHFSLNWLQRVWLLGIVFAGMVLVITGEHVYCAPVGLDIVYPPHARHFLPVLPLLAVALTPSRPAAGTATKLDRIPSTAIMATVTLAFVVTSWLRYN